MRYRLPVPRPCTAHASLPAASKPQRDQEGRCTACRTGTDVRHLLKNARSLLFSWLQGTEELTSEEIAAACEERGMRATGLSGGDAEYRRQLDDWLELSVRQQVRFWPRHFMNFAFISTGRVLQVPAVLLVLSRALMLSGGPLVAPPPLVRGCICRTLFLSPVAVAYITASLQCNNHCTGHS